MLLVADNHLPLAHHPIQAVGNNIGNFLNSAQPILGWSLLVSQAVSR